MTVLSFHIHILTKLGYEVNTSCICGRSALKTNRHCMCLPAIIMYIMTTSNSPMFCRLLCRLLCSGRIFSDKPLPKWSNTAAHVAPMHMWGSFRLKSYSIVTQMHSTGHVCPKVLLCVQPAGEMLWSLSCFETQ